MANNGLAAKIMTYIIPGLEKEIKELKLTVNHLYNKVIKLENKLMEEQNDNYCKTRKKRK